MLRQSLWRNENGKEGICAGGGGHGCGSGEMASGILSLGISFGLRMERRAEQLKDTDTVQEVPARFRMRTWDGTVISGEGCVRRQTVTGRNRELFIYGFGMEPGTGELERQSLDPVFSDQRETE